MGGLVLIFFDYFLFVIFENIAEKHVIFCCRPRLLDGDAAVCVVEQGGGGGDGNGWLAEHGRGFIDFYFQ